MTKRKGEMMYKVMIVEDDRASRFLCRQLKEWKEYGFVVSAEASNGKEALKLLKQEQFDLVMTDIRMPFMDGLKLLESIQELDAVPLTVLVSSYDEFEYARKGMVLGAADFLVKPMNGKKLAQLLERIAGKMEKGNGFLEYVLKCLEIQPDPQSILYRVCSYLVRHIEEQVSMENVADHVKLSKDYLGKTVKQQSGKTFGSLSLYIKMEYAKVLISTGSYKTYEISELLGYSSPDYFTRLFKEHTGMTPTQYKSESDN